MTVQMIITIALVVLGLLFMIASLIGIARFPDFFARLHAQGVTDTLGAFLMLAGMAVFVGAHLLSVKLVLIFLVIVLTNPIGTNLMMIAAINKEDYQGYSTKTSGGKSAKDDPAAEPVAKPSAAAKAAAAPEVREPEASEEKRPAAKRRKRKPAAVNNQKPADRPDKRDKKTEQDKKPEVGSQRKKPKTDKDRKPASKPAGQVNAKQSSDDKAGSDRKKKNRSRRNKPSMNMNKAELTRIAQSRGIDVPESATKREILDLIYSQKDKKE